MVKEVCVKFSRGSLAGGLRTTRPGGKAKWSAGLDILLCHGHFVVELAWQSSLWEVIVAVMCKDAT